MHVQVQQRLQRVAGRVLDRRNGFQRHQIRAGRYHGIANATALAAWRASLRDLAEPRRRGFYYLTFDLSSSSKLNTLTLSRDDGWLVPDDDKIPSSLAAPWKRVLRCLRNRRPSEETVNAVTSALAATIRAVHGVPDLPEIATRMQEAAARGTAVQSRVPGSADARRHVPTDVAERAAAGFAATMPSELALVSPPQAAFLLAKRVIAGLAYHYGLDRIGPLLAADGIYSTRELQELFAEILASDQVSKLTKRWPAKPNGEGLRAPARLRRVRRSLDDIVNTPIAELL